MPRGPRRARGAGSGAILEVTDCVNTMRGTLDVDSGLDSTGSIAAVRGILRTAVKKLPLHVLVVDDEPLIRWSVTETLAELGLDVEQADSAASALQSITTTALPFDAIVLDLRLPDMNDLSLLATIRQLIPEAPVVVMTAFGTPEVLAAARALGVSAVLNKPFELAELSRVVGAALKRG
jgi:CheY-like chemotaxis protein